MQLLIPQRQDPTPTLPIRLAAVQRQAQATITRLDAKLAELARMRSALARLTTECRGPHLPNECPIFAVLDTPALDTLALEDETDHATR